MLKHQGHHTSSLVERRIGKVSFLFHCPQPTVPPPRVRCQVRFCYPIEGAGGSGELARSLLWLCAPLGESIPSTQPVRVLCSAEPNLRRSIRVAYPPG